MHAVVHHYEEGPQGVVVRYDDALERKISQIEVILGAKYGEMENMRGMRLSFWSRTRK